MTLQLITYLGVGVLSAVVDIGTMEGLIFFGVHYGSAASLGFAVGLVFNYICHARVTFRAKSKMSTVFRFGILVLVNYLLTMICVVACQQWFDSALTGKLLSLPLVAANGFLAGKYWVFR